MHISRLFVVAFATVAFSAGCTIAQAPECETFVSCQAHYDETYALSPTNTEAYGPMGTCWGNETRAAGCTESCAQAAQVLEQALKDSGEDPGACASEG